MQVCQICIYSDISILRSPVAITSSGRGVFVRSSPLNCYFSISRQRFSGVFNRFFVITEFSL